MDTREDKVIAEAMVRLHGGEAQAVAEGHAARHRNLGDEVTHNKWLRVSRLIEELKKVRTDYHGGS